MSSLTTDGERAEQSTIVHTWDVHDAPETSRPVPSTSSRRQPCGYGGATSSGSQTDDEIADDSNGTAPLLGAPSSSTDVRIDVPEENKPASPHDRFPKERAKALLAVVSAVVAGFLNTLVLSFVHEYLPDASPLPDLGFRLTTYYADGLAYCEYLMLGAISLTLVIILFHRHRWIVLRRFGTIGAFLYLCRCITMAVTIVPLADPNYYCSEKLGPNGTLWAITLRAIEVFSGMGLKLFGKHSLCGDYIYSGHTIVLTVSALFINEYSPRRWKFLHYLSWLNALAGMFLLVISRGHYTIDIILSYFICTRTFWTYHTLAAHPTLRTSPHSHHRKEWWFHIFRYLEGNIVKPIPRRYNVPFPLPAAWLRRRKANVQ